MSFVRQHKGAVVWSLALHVAVLAGAVVGLPWFEKPRAPVATAVVPIEATMIDTAAIERAQEVREQVARQERQRQQREENERRQVAEQQRQAEQREQRVREEAAQKERERVAAEKAEQARKEQQARVAREQQAQRDKEAADKRARDQAEQRRRQQAESELAQSLALEAEANAAREAGLLDQYISAIENKIERSWIRPLSAREGLDCMVRVVQLPSGDVMSAQVASCNGDEAVRRSIEKAVMDASPLPKPSNPALFERNLNVNFKPEE